MASTFSTPPATPGTTFKSGGGVVYDYDNVIPAWVLSPTAVTDTASVSPTTFDENDTLTITGTGFTGATAVRFNQAAANSFTVVNDTTITCDASAVGVITSTIVSVQLASGVYLACPELCTQNASGGPFAEAYWELEDNTDSGPNGLTLTETGSPTYTAAKINNGISDGRLSIASSTELDLSATDFSWSLWFNAASVSGFQSILDKDSNGASSGRNYSITLFGAQLRWISTGTGSPAAYNFTGTITASTDYHVVVTHNTTTNELLLYLNGTLNNTHTTQGINHNTQELGIRARENGSDEMNTGGWVDQVMLVKQILTPAQVTSLYNGGAGIADPTTVL